MKEPLTWERLQARKFEFVPKRVQKRAAKLVANSEELEVTPERLTRGLVQETRRFSFGQVSLARIARKRRKKEERKGKRLGAAEEEEEVTVLPVEDEKGRESSGLLYKWYISYI